MIVELIEEGGEGRSGDNIGLWVGHPTVLPPSSSLLDVEAGFDSASVAAPLAAYMS